MKIVVIEAWGLHVGYLGCYGNDWVATPNLDRLAAEGVVFDWHYAARPVLLPTSPPPLDATRWRIVRCEALAGFAATVLSAIEADASPVWIEGPSLVPPWHLDDDLLRVYFDEDDDEEGLEAWKDPPLEIVKLSEAEVLELQNTYAAVVTFFDAQLGSLVEALREKQSLDNTFLCVTARSGLPLGEHGMIGTPRPTLHDEFTHLPLVLRLQGGAEAGLRVAALTQPSDLLATLTESPVEESTPPNGAEGTSLWPLIRGEVASIRPFAASSMRVGESEIRLLRTMDWAFHLAMAEPRKQQIFAKPEDRWEVNDLIQQQSETAEAMAKTLAEAGI